MKLIAMLACLMVMACATASTSYAGPAQQVASAPPWVDDAIHITLGAGIAYGVGKIGICDGWCGRALQVAVPLLIGVAWELTNDDFNPQDVAGWALGAGVVLVFEF